MRMLLLLALVACARAATVGQIDVPGQFTDLRVIDWYDPVTKKRFLIFFQTDTGIAVVEATPPPPPPAPPRPVPTEVEASGTRTTTHGPVPPGWKQVGTQDGMKIIEKLP